MINKIDNADDDEDGFNDSVDEDGIWKKIAYVGFEMGYVDNMVIVLFDLFDDVDWFDVCSAFICKSVYLYMVTLFLKF